ncbi:MAG: hypothetical protein AAF331_08705 [Pseudomonadota bacterium]
MLIKKVHEMVEFGPNGTVMARDQDSDPDQAAYTVPTVTRLKRIGLASFLCGMAACVLVTLIGVILLFLGFQISSLFGRDAGLIFSDEGFLQGIGFATLMSAMNWYFAYFTVPAAWVAMWFSLGRFPRRGIVRPQPYYRWGAIWGGFLVGSTTGIASFLLIDMNPLATLGGFATGAIIGAVAGLICGAIFRGIVRPAEQVKQIQVDVF